MDSEDWKVRYYEALRERNDAGLAQLGSEFHGSESGHYPSATPGGCEECQ